MITDKRYLLPELKPLLDAMSGKGREEAYTAFWDAIDLVESWRDRNKIDYRLYRELIHIIHNKFKG